MTEPNKDFSVTLKDIQTLNEQVSLLKGNMETLSNDLFLSIKDVQNITNWSKKTVETLFNHPAFPCTDLGKSKLVLKPAFIKFFMDRRCRDNEDYWNYAS